ARVGAAGCLRVGASVVVVVGVIVGRACVVRSKGRLRDGGGGGIADPRAERGFGGELPRGVLGARIAGGLKADELRSEEIVVLPKRARGVERAQARREIAGGARKQDPGLQPRTTPVLDGE